MGLIVRLGLFCGRKCPVGFFCPRKYNAYCIHHYSTRARCHLMRYQLTAAIFDVLQVCGVRMSEGEFPSAANQELLAVSHSDCLVLHDPSKKLTLLLCRSESQATMFSPANELVPELRGGLRPRCERRNVLAQAQRLGGQSRVRIGITTNTAGLVGA